MAHADYNCCARCDRKLDYAGMDARAKEDLCGPCIVVLHAISGEIITSGEQLCELIKRSTAEQVTAMGISRCHYGNLVDGAVVVKGAQFTPSWTDRAVALLDPGTEGDRDG